jgi:hypothetical protein
VKTDKELLKIFEAAPQWVFVLTRLPSPGNCTLRSVVIKALERRADAVIVPAASDQPLTIVEFQLGRDETVYQRLVAEMAVLQGMHPIRTKLSGSYRNEGSETSADYAD